MPFFSSTDYLTTPLRFWIWVAFTVPSTAIAFIIYQKVMKRSKARLEDEEAQHLVTGPDSNVKRLRTTPAGLVTIHSSAVHGKDET
jgi:hypothetical protein